MEDAERPLVLVVDDDEPIRVLVQRWLERDGFRVETASGGHAARDFLSRALPDAVCLDLHMPDAYGLDVLAWIRLRTPDLPVIVVTTDTQVETVVDAMKKGAHDYLIKPIDRTRLHTTVRNAVEQRQLREQVAELSRERDADHFGALFGASPPMQRLFRTLQKVAKSEVSVLVRGESGTGKELVAQGLHDRSARRDGPFVAVNCAALPETLVESELFGHERGAFTGAEVSRVGRFEAADGGTLFLDEIAELALPVQAKLLRVLETRAVTRLGAADARPVDFRLVTATHQDLEAATEQGRFREDLFYRIAVFDVQTPPLRVRGDDVIMLARRFLERAEPERTCVLSKEAEDALARYAWPGNVRELRNAMQRAAVACEGDVVEVSDLPARLARDGGESPARAPEVSDAPAGAPASAPALSLGEIERRAILDSYRRHGGDIARVVAELGIGRTTLYRRLKEYGVGRDMA